MTYLQTQISFHNTIQLSGNELKEAIVKCKRQEDKIYLLMKGKPSKTAYEVWDLYCSILPLVPITSIRRALTNMCKETPPRMIKGSKHLMKQERMGKPNYKYLAI